jgi:NAD(P)-dependent dehydrogenase (short-subunit alcohol dehydrogenase family)
MTIDNKVVLVTGAARGIGRALVAEALRRGAQRVYAGARGPLDHPDRRVTPLRLDVTDLDQIRAAAAQVPALDVLVNNAGRYAPDDLTDRAAVEAHLAVNLYGPLAVTEAFLPQLIRSGGIVVNNLSLAALAPIPITPAYSVSKAAALSMTQSQRILFAAHGIRVHAVLTGPTDTDMVRDLPVPKAAPEAVARAILDAVDAGQDDIFPDPLSRSLAEAWHVSPAKTLERQNAALAL